MQDPILVATDGGPAAMGALELAAAYASAEGVPVEVVSVVEPLSDLPMPLPHRAELELAHARGVAEGVRDRIRDSVGPVDWPIHVRYGRPAAAICTTARARNARMIILGMEARRSDGSDIAVEVLHLAERRVLVARGGALPRAAVAWIDFRTSSLRAAEEAARLMGPEGLVHLVHIKPSLDFPAASVWRWGPCYARAVDGLFDGVARALAALGVSRVERHARSGDPAAELTAAALELDADLLAIGSDGYTCNGRVVVGHVARHVLATATMTVLAMPVAATLDGPFADFPGSAGSAGVMPGRSDDRPDPGRP